MELTNYAFTKGVTNGIPPVVFDISQYIFEKVLFWNKFSSYIYSGQLVFFKLLKHEK